LKRYKRLKKQSKWNILKSKTGKQLEGSESIVANSFILLVKAYA
jgi:hypothetical protein